MRIMLDTNVLLSAAFFPNKRTESIIESISTRHELVLPDVGTKELLAVAAYPEFDRVPAMKRFIRNISFTKFRTPKVKPISGLEIRDENDYPILFAAVKSGVNILISGDSDFLECSIKKPRIMTLTQYAKEYMR
jgi:predicted nucleic acid-binding protein